MVAGAYGLHGQPAQWHVERDWSHVSATAMHLFHKEVETTVQVMDERHRAVTRTPVQVSIGYLVTTVIFNSHPDVQILTGKHWEDDFILSRCYIIIRAGRVHKFGRFVQSENYGKDAHDIADDWEHPKF